MWWIGFKVNLLFCKKTILEVFYIKQDLPINEQIRAKEVQIIDAEGNKIGPISLNEALDIAYEKKLDLVLVAPNAQPPVCKLMNYGKYKFEQAKKEKEAKKKQKAIELKEIRITPNIEEHDFSFKAKNAKKFIEFALSPDCVNLAQDNGSYQFLVIDNAKPVEVAIKNGLDKIETMVYNFDDAKTNGPKYYAEFFEVISKDDRVKTK